MIIKVTEKVFQESLARLAESEDGRIFFAWLREFCFHNGTPLARGNLQDTYANAAVQNVYRTIRAGINRENLKRIEFDYVVEKSKEEKDNE